MDWEGVGGFLKQFGSPANALSAVMSARGENPGEQVDPRLQGKTPAELAIYDRYANAQHARNEYGLPLAAAGITLGAVPYEAAKGLMQATGTDKLMSGVGSFFGHPDYGIDNTTSPASWNNVASYYHGLFDE